MPKQAKTRSRMAKPNDDDSVFPRSDAPAQGPVERLGLTFPNHQARRDHFLEKLREVLSNGTLPLKPRTEDPTRARSSGRRVGGGRP